VSRRKERHPFGRYKEVNLTIGIHYKSYTKRIHSITDSHKSEMNIGSILSSENGTEEKCSFIN
jgi:hypothetical protein